jgi:hypothetical protein
LNLLDRPLHQSDGALCSTNHDILVCFNAVHRLFPSLSQATRGYMLAIFQLDPLGFAGRQKPHSFPIHKPHFL